MTAYFDRASEELLPRILAVFAFVAGVVLLFSGATPAAAGRLALLTAFCRSASSKPHTSLAGHAALLLLSHGLARRLNTAYYLTAHPGDRHRVVAARGWGLRRSRRPGQVLVLPRQIDVLL
jgi:lysylphosphatidylglycerol synthetase-like protein (DUF2156 family)